MEHLSPNVEFAGFCKHGNVPNRCIICNREEKNPQPEGTLEINKETEQLATELGEAIDQKICEIFLGIQNDIIATNTNDSLSPSEKMKQNKELFSAAVSPLLIPGAKKHKPEIWLGHLHPYFKTATIVFSYNNNERQSADFDSLDNMKGYEKMASKLEMGIGVQSLLSAQTEQEFTRILERLRLSIYHESEHFAYKGTDLKSGIKGTFDYYANQGEMRAFAKQFAVDYVNRFPGQPFDLQTMQSFCNPEWDKSAFDYFITFADPAKQAQYAEYADLATLHNQLVALTRGLVNHLNERAGKKAAA